MYFLDAIKEIKFNFCILVLFVNNFILGLKIDLRDDPATLRALQADKRTPISKNVGQKMATKTKAYKYLECSALTQQGLSAVCVFKIFFY